MVEASEGAGINALCVPEFTFSKVMRPYDGFEAVYQGQGVAHHPIMFSEEGVAYDEIAASGADGYDPNLVRGLPCKIGQRVIVLLPLFPVAAGELIVPHYIWQFMWRLRNLHDFRVAQRTRYNYSLPKQGQGTPDTLGPNPGARVVVPAVVQSVVYNQAEPAVLGGPPLINHLRTEQFQPYIVTAAYPFMPDGAAGVVQQGITDGGTSPLFGVYELQAVGDEFLLGLNRLEADGLNWAFNAFEIDHSLSVFLNPATPDLGAYVCRGLAPGALTPSRAP